MTYKLFIDVSDYQPILKTSDLAGHISALVVKACEVDDQPWNLGDAMDKFVETGLYAKVQQAYDLKIPCAVYIFDNPNWTSINGGTWRDHNLHPNSGDPRILALRQALRNKTYHAIVIDVERWWRSYNQYLSYLRGAMNVQMHGLSVGEPDPILSHARPEHLAKAKTYAPAGVNRGLSLSSAVVEKIPPLWIHDSAEDMYNRIREDQVANQLRPVPIWFYYGGWFVNGYCPLLDSLLAGKIQWQADYTTNVYKQTISKVMTWEALQALVDAQVFNPKWFGNQRPELMQLTDAVIPPGIYEGTKAKPVDVNVALVELDKVFAPGEWNDTTPPPDPGPDPIPVPTVKYFATIRQTATGLKLRTAPSTTAPILDYDFRPLPKFEIAGAPVVYGAITWASLGMAWFAVKQGTTEPYAVITEEPKG